MQDLEDILRIWKLLPRLERRDILGAWILRSSDVEYDDAGKVTGIKFDHKPFRESCKKHFFYLINGIIAPKLQALMRGYIFRKRSDAVPRGKNMDVNMSHNQKGRQRKLKAQHDVIIGSALETSTILSEDASLKSHIGERSHNFDDEDIEDEVDICFHNDHDIMNSKTNNIDDQHAEEVEEDISRVNEAKPVDIISEVTEGREVEYFQHKTDVEEPTDVSRNNVIKSTKQIEYRVRPVIHSTLNNGSRGANIGTKCSPHQKGSKSFPNNRRLDHSKSPTQRKGSKVSNHGASRNIKVENNGSPSSHRFSKQLSTDSPGATHRKGIGSSKQKISMQDIIIEQEPSTSLGGFLSSMVESDDSRDRSNKSNLNNDGDTGHLVDEINELRSLVQSQMTAFIGEVGALSVSIQKSKSSPLKHESGILSEKGGIYNEESKYHDLDSMRSEILELKHLVDELRKNSDSPIKQQGHNEKDNSLSKPQSGIEDGDFTPIIITGDETQFQMSGLFPPSPHRVPDPRSPVNSFNNNDHTKAIGDDVVDGDYITPLGLIVEEDSNDNSTMGHGLTPREQVNNFSLESPHKYPKDPLNVRNGLVNTDKDANFDALDEADSVLQKEIHALEERKALQEKAVQARQKEAMPVISNFVRRTLERNKRIRELESRMLKKSEGKDNTAQARTLRQICDDMSCSIRCGSIRLAALTLLDLSEYFVTATRLSYTIAVVKDCPDFTRLLVQYLNSFISVKEVTPDACVALSILIQKRVLMKELLNDGLVECLMRTALRNRNLPNFVIDTFDMIEFIVCDMPEGYTPGMVLQPVTLQLLNHLVPYIVQNDIKAVRKVFGFVYNICLDRAMQESLERTNFLSVMAGSCFYLYSEIEVLTIAFNICHLFVMRKSDQAKVFNNPAHAELIVECLVNYAELNSSKTIKHFRLIVELLLVVCKSCSDFIQHFPVHHFLTNMKVFLENVVDNIFVVPVLNLLKSIMVIFPSLKGKAAALHYSDVLLPIIRENNCVGSEQVTALNLQKLLYPNWDPVVDNNDETVFRTITTPNSKRNIRRLSSRNSRRATPDNSSNRQVMSRDGFSENQMSRQNSDAWKFRPHSTSNNELLAFWQDTNINIENFSSSRNGPRIDISENDKKNPQVLSHAQTLADSSRISPSPVVSPMGRVHSAGPLNNTRFDSSGKNRNSPMVSLFDEKPSSVLSVSMTRTPSAPKNPKPSSQRPGLLRMSKARALAIITKIVFRHVSRLRMAKLRVVNKSNAMFKAAEIRRILSEGNDTENDEKYQKLKAERKLEKKAKKKHMKTPVLAPDGKDKSTNSSTTSAIYEIIKSVDMGQENGEIGDIGTSNKIEPQGENITHSNDVKTPDILVKSISTELSSAISRPDRIDVPKLLPSHVASHMNSAIVSKNSEVRGGSDIPFNQSTEVTLGHGNSLNHQNGDIVKSAANKDEVEPSSFSRANLARLESTGKFQRTVIRPDTISDEDLQMNRIHSADGYTNDSGVSNLPINLPTEEKLDRSNSTRSQNVNSENSEEKNKAHGKSVSDIDESLDKSIYITNSAVACMKSLEVAIENRNNVAYISILGKVFALVRAEINSTDNDMSELLVQHTNLIIQGATSFMSEKKTIAAILDVLWLIKSKLKKKLEMKKYKMFGVLKAILIRHKTNVEICKQVIRLYGKKSIGLADNDFVKVLLSVFKEHASMKDFRSEVVRLLTLCITKDMSFKSTIQEEEGCAFILKMFMLHGKGDELEGLVNIILLLATDHIENSSFFGSSTAISMYMSNLLPNVNDEDSFNLATVPLFYALKTFSDPETVELDDSVMEPILGLFDYADSVKDEEVRNSILETCLRFARELATMKASSNMFLRTGFLGVVSKYIQPQHSAQIRKLGKSVVKKLQLYQEEA